MAFYKLDGEDLLCAPNFVHGPSYDLSAEQCAEYTYPVQGWYWFDTEGLAREFYGLPDPQPQE